MLNYALLLQCVVKDFDLAEKFYRRAVAADCDDTLVMRNYRDFEAQRLPGGLYAGGGPALGTLKTSTVEEARFEWGDWALMRNTRAFDARFALYWASELLGRTAWAEPKWAEVWQVICLRSKAVSDLNGGWREWHDPRRKVTFFSGPDGAFQEVNPFQTGALKR